jgi:hypothetical protein
MHTQMTNLLSFCFNKDIHQIHKSKESSYMIHSNSQDQAVEPNQKIACGCCAALTLYVALAGGDSADEQGAQRQRVRARRGSLKASLLGDDDGALRRRWRGGGRAAWRHVAASLASWRPPSPWPIGLVQRKRGMGNWGSVDRKKNAMCSSLCACVL